MIFPVLKNESVVQVNDKTRLDASETYITPDEAAITLVEIEPEAGAGYFDVTNSDYKLDWQYATDGAKTATVRVTTDSTPETFTSTITSITEADDNLFSTDAQIFEIESELKRYIPTGRNSYKNLHREAQSRILNYLFRKRIWNENGDPLTKDQLNLDEQLQKWSLYETIYMIYSDLVISVGDKFIEKSTQYKILRDAQRKTGAIRIDLDSSGSIDANEETQDLKSYRMIKR